jgi:hypothetical protein
MPISKSNGAVATPPAAKQDVAQTAPAPVSRKLDTGTTPVDNRKTSSYDDNKNRRILVQGITQAVVQSPILAGLGYTDEKQAVEIVKNVSRQLIAFVDEESK